MPCLFGCKCILEECCKCLQFFFLIEIDIQLLILQPFISIDANIPLPVGINDKGIGGILVPVRLVNLISAVISRISIAGESGNSRHHHNRVRLSPLSSEGDMRFEESSDTVKSSHFLMLIRIYHTACKKYSDNPANPVTSSSYSAG